MAKKTQLDKLVTTFTSGKTLTVAQAQDPWH